MLGRVNETCLAAGTVSYFCVILPLSSLLQGIIVSFTRKVNIFMRLKGMLLYRERKI